MSDPDINEQNPNSHTAAGELSDDDLDVATGGVGTIMPTLGVIGDPTGGALMNGG